MSPVKPATRCKAPRCPLLVMGTSRFCPRHTTEHGKARRERETWRSYGAAWQTISNLVRLDQPHCADCPPQRPNPSEEVHHVLSLRDGGTNSRGNAIGLCRSHHAKRHRDMKIHASGGSNG